ncbi:MAG: hypothetical protein C5T88_03340 [Williamsoniiplasma luminosum]|uniref:Uncharacterized protein n=2 Tax=Williamsoniiplasma luminosum TaxID=214888 RepID=A0A2S0NKP6_9MOLU|nr:MAG: hypothetical protein C5T88_03340 [Williamsoniiplasma luminosum]
MLRIDAINNKTKYFENVQNLAYDIAKVNKDMEGTSMNDYISLCIAKKDDFQYYLVYVLREMLANANLYRITKDQSTYEIQGQDLENLIPFKLMNLTSNNSAYVIWNIVKEGPIALSDISLNPDIRNLVDLTFKEIVELEEYNDQIDNLWKSGLKDYFAMKMSSLTKTEFQNQKAKELQKLNNDLAKAEAEKQPPDVIQKILDQIDLKKLEIKVRFDQYDYQIDQMQKNTTIFQKKLTDIILNTSGLDQEQLIEKIKNLPEYQILMLSNFYFINYKEQVQSTYKVMQKVIPDLVQPDKFDISDEENAFMLKAKIEKKNTMDLELKSSDGIVVNLNEILINDDLVNSGSLQEYKGR